MRRTSILRPSAIPQWPEPFDPRFELDWSRPDYSRRLLREHLDQGHDGASRRVRVIDSQVRRLRALLPRPPARILDAACGPGLYAARLADAGHDVTGVDVSPAALRHARGLARTRDSRRGALRFMHVDLREPVRAAPPYDGCILIYYVLESFPAREQPRVLRHLRDALAEGGRILVEMRLRPDQLPGRIEWWDVVPQSVLGDRRHLLIGDTTYDARRHTYVLRELAVFDDGSVASQQTSGWLCPFERIPRMFARAGLAVRDIHDGWTSAPGTPLSESVLVVAERV